MLITIVLWLAFNALLFVWLGFVRYRKWCPVPHHKAVQLM